MSAASRLPGRSSRSTAAQTRASSPSTAPPDECQGDGLLDQRVVILAWPGPGQAEHRFQDFSPVLAVLIVCGQLGQRRRGDLVGGCRVAELFQAADQRALHGGELAARVQVAANVMGGLPRDDPLHQGGIRVPGNADGLLQHDSGELAPGAGGQRRDLLGQARRRGVSEPGQACGPDHPRIVLLPVGAQDLKGPVGLADQQGTARPGQYGRLRARPSPGPGPR